MEGSQTGGAPQWRYVYNTALTETGVGQPDWWRPAVEVRLQHGVNQETGVRQPDWWRPAVEVRLQHGVNGDRCRAARLVAPRSGGTSTTRHQPRDRCKAARLVAPRSGGTFTTRRQPRQVYGSQPGGAPQWRYVYNAASTKTGVGQSDWRPPAVEVRLQHGVNQDR